MYLFGRTKEGGSLLVGNPSDDWILQEELNRFMDEPANHPGALADVGHAHDRYEIEIVEGGQLIDMRNVEEGSPMYGARKRIRFIPGEQAMVACYRVPETSLPLAVESCLSPDYYGLLREGRAGVSETTGASWRGWRLGDACAWVGRADGESVEWEEARAFAVGHGMSALLRSAQAHFHVFIGAGRPTAPRCEKLMRRGIALVDGPSTEGMRASARSA